VAGQQVVKFDSRHVIWVLCKLLVQRLNKIPFIQQACLTF
jgi:hypothetical protein